jgi:polyhydroxyalkanoate synthase subunit PhaC
MSSSIDREQAARTTQPGSDHAPADVQILLDRMLREFIAKLPDSDGLALQQVFRSLAAQPERVGEIQARYYREHLALWSRALAPASQQGETAPATDPRFDDPEWSAIPWFDFLKRSYLLNARWLTELLDIAELPSEKKRRAAFVLRQHLDALAPTNFPATNPQVIRLATQTRGVSLAVGLEHLRRDLTRGRIQMSDETAFEVGRNLAITPGFVVYQNPIMQLIQYAPRTPEVSSRPLLIVPPFINKYYVLDLQPDNSYVRYALEQGMQVFLVSWRNVPRELGGSTWENYVRQGVYAPLEVVREITGADKVNTLGFCVGGTLLASALAVIKEPRQVASLTLLATMLDFSDVGEIGVYVDEEYVRQCEETYREGGLMPGAVLASTFASLRANELVWYFVINNYLKGKTPRAFDLLYWNSDGANLPGRLYAWYLRNAYLENNLRVPGKLILCERQLDLGAIRCAAFVLATREDHIVPWRSAYASTQLLAGRIEFVLAASGHIAGIVNPPAAGRRSHWLGKGTPASGDDWMAQAESRPGSWWPHWSAWLKRRSGSQVPAPKAAGSGRYPPLEPAPGSYVREPGS